MARTFKVYHVICEGSSEIAYLKELGKYLREFGLEMFLNLYLYDLEGISSYSNIKRQYRKILKNRDKADEVFIWLDNDVFKRGKLSKEMLQKILGGFSGIKYNYENFEDFLVLHLSDELVNNWYEICRKENHFNIPMNGENVERLVKQIFSDYSKGYLPKEVQINDESLHRLCKNQDNKLIKFNSDFIGVIEKLLKHSNE